VSTLDPNRLHRLIEVGRSLLGELDLDLVLERVLDAARDLTGARYAALGVLDPDHEELERFITRGVDPDTRARIGDLPRGHGVLGTLIRDPRPLRLTDVGAHPDSWGFPAGHPPMSTFLGVPIVIRGQAFGNLYLTEKEDGEFDETDEETMVVLADWAAIAISNAEAHRAVRGRRDDLERAVSGLEATTEIARAVGSETRLDRVLELIVKRGRGLVCARAMAILVQEGDEVVVTAVAGQLDNSILGTRLPVEESVSGQVLKTGRAERLADPGSRLRSGLATTLGAKAGLYVPLLHQGRALGVLNAFDRLEDGPEFDPDDQRLMESFAASAAVAIATAENAAAQALGRSIEAAEHERGRWARELHDQTLQELGALSVRLSSARRSGDLDVVHAIVDESLHAVSDATAGLRALINDLRPASLDQLGLEPALEGLAGRAREQNEVRVNLDVDLAYESGRESKRLAPELESAAYRLVQEALTNVLKHAGAEQVEVRVAEDERALSLSVRDDGAGFSTSSPTVGFGLLGMRERVSLVGGTIAIESSPGAGTTIGAELPVVRAGQAPPVDSAPSGSADAGRSGSPPAGAVGRLAKG
jgi:signal transduction histidine kinase